MTQSLAIPRVIPEDWKRLDLIINKIKMRLGSAGSPTFAGVTVTGLTASTLIGANASKALESVTVGTGLDYTRPNLTLSHLGIEALTDPGADKILFWDDTASACKWLGMGNSVAITDVTLDTIQDIRVTASPTFTGLHINSAEVISTTLLTLESDISNNNEYNEILFKVGGGLNYGAIRSCVGAVAGDSYMSFFTTTDGGTLVRKVTIQHNGKVGFGTYNPETLLTMVNAAPYLTLYNITEEDTDGGGESRLIYKREDGAGTGTACFQFEASHDGSGANDQLGKGVWSVNTGAGLVEGMRLDSSLTATFAGVIQATDFAKTGWPVTSGVTLSFVGGTTRTFTVTDGGSAYYYIDGVKYTLGENKTVVIDDLEGLWFIYFDGAALTASQTIWSFADEDKAIVAYLYWARDVGTPANGKAIFIGWELHSFHMSGATHARLHYAGGARWETGLLVADNLDNTVDVSAGDIWDEDLNIPITDGAGSALFEQVLSPAQLPIYYREGASAWRIYETNEKAALTDVGYLTGGDLKYNDPTTTWSNETVGLNNYVAYYVVATNEQTEPVVLIMGQRADNKLSEAQANNVFAGLSLAGLPFEELAVLARLILKDTGTYTLEEVLDLRAYNIKGNITSPLITQHAGLGGLNWSSSGHYFDAAVDFNAQNISNIGTVGCGVITQSGATLANTYQPLHANLTSLATLTYAAASFVKMTGADTFVLRTIAETKTDLSLNLVENTALSTWAGTANITTLGTIATVGNITIANGGTIGQAAGPLLTFDDTNNDLEITGCRVSIREGTHRLYEDPLYLFRVSKDNYNIASTTSLLISGGRRDTGQPIGHFIQSSMVGSVSGTTFAIVEAIADYTNNKVTVGTTRFFINKDGKVGIGTTTPISTASGIDISSGGLSLIIGADNLGSSRTDETEKDGRFACAHYTNAEEPVGILLASIVSAQNYIFFGGGSGLANAATELRFYTAANTTTTTGTVRATITNTQIKLTLPIFIKEQAAATADIATYGQIWTKTATPNQLWFTDDAGNDIQLGRGYVTVNSAVVFNTSLTAVNTWQDLDLSAYTGSNDAVVFLQIDHINANKFAVKKKGTGVADVTKHMSMVGGTGFGTCALYFSSNTVGYLTCTTDANGVIQIASDNNANTFTIKLIGYIT